MNLTDLAYAILALTVATIAIGGFALLCYRVATY